jgi:uncharacterized protein YggT (Ycf19 family)
LEIIFSVIAKTVSLFFDFVLLAMMIRAILSFFVKDPEGNPLFMFVGVVTEIFVTPVRFIMFNLNIGQDSPIDWAFFVTYILMTILGSMMPVI